MAKLLKIHGRSSFRAIVTFKDSKTAALVDLSAKILVFETAGGKFRKPLLPSASGSVTERVLYLSVADVDLLPITPTAFIVRDESVPGAETIMEGGTIQRTGWKVTA